MLVKEMEIKRLFIRFLKNNDLYKYKDMINSQHFQYCEIIIKIFDHTIIWSTTNEGNLFWYKIQLYWTKFCIDNFKFFEEDVKKSYIIKYFAKLLGGYSSLKVNDEQWYIDLYNYYRSLFK